MDATGAVSGSVQRIAAHPLGDRVLVLVIRFPVGAPQNAAVAVIDVRTAQKLEEYPLRYPTGVSAPQMALSSDGSTLLAGFLLGTEIQVFDTSTGEETQSLPVNADFGFGDVAAA